MGLINPPLKKSLQMTLQTPYSHSGKQPISRHPFLKNPLKGGPTP